MAKKLTLKEIGELSGVSRSTVSRVINEQPDVKADVRERVLKVIRETGFVPNPAARSLAANRSGLLGLVIPRSVATFFGDPYFSRLTQGITQACYDHGYMLSLFLFYTEKDEQLLLPFIAQQSFLDGVIVQATTDDDPIIPHLQKNSMPFLVVGRLGNMDPSWNYIDVDNVSGAYKAVKHLVELGHRRIAHISGGLDNRAALDRKSGYEKALRDYQLPVDPNLIQNGNFTEEEAYACVTHLLPHHPDAIFVASDIMALGAVRAIKEAGLNVPNDIAIVGYDDLSPAQRCEPQLTTIKQPILRFGINAVEILIGMIDNNIQQPYYSIYDTELVIRNSCGAKPS